MEEKIKYMKTQFGELVTAGLHEGTLTIEVGEEVIAQAGKYAIVPIEDYKKLVSVDETRNESLKLCPHCNSVNIKPIVKVSCGACEHEIKIKG